MREIGLLFDLDGTLIDSLGDITKALNRVRLDLNLPLLPHDRVKAAIGKGAEFLIREAIPEAAPAQQTDLVNRYKRYYVENFPPTGTLYPEVKETLIALSRRSDIALGIVTNKSSGSADQALSYYLPEIPFRIVAGPERVTARKPNPAHILEVLPKLGVPAMDTLYMGDDPVDLQCAQAAGVRFLAAAYGLGGVGKLVPPESRIFHFSELLEKLNLLFVQK